MRHLALHWLFDDILSQAHSLLNAFFSIRHKAFLKKAYFFILQLRSKKIPEKFQTTRRKVKSLQKELKEVRVDHD